MTNKPPKEESGLGVLDQIGIRLVPERPTAMMCKAGCAAGDIDPHTVQRIYNAMLLAAIDCPLHGDHSLN